MTEFEISKFTFKFPAKQKGPRMYVHDSNITASVVTIVRLAYIIINSTP